MISARTFGGSCNVGPAQQLGSLSAQSGHQTTRRTGVLVENDAAEGRGVNATASAFLHNQDPKATSIPRITKPGRACRYISLRTV
jgi:hypothetical protein